MIVDKSCDFIHPSFMLLPKAIQDETLGLISTVNTKHLHCEDKTVWPQVHCLITDLFAEGFARKEKKHQQAVAQRPGAPLQAAPTQPPAQQRCASFMFPLSQDRYTQVLKTVKRTLEETFYDHLFTNPVVEALQQHILTPLQGDSELVVLLLQWIQLNAMYLPLGGHLLNSFKEDMEGKSSFAKHVMAYEKIPILQEALSQKTIDCMIAFLSDCAQAHCQSYGPPALPTNKPTAVMLSIKNGAGGHTAPTQAMAARLEQQGWKVHTIHYDEDLSPDSDSFQLLGITFEDNTPMTESLYQIRWKMQKHNRDIARIVGYYVISRKILTPELFINDSGGDLLRKHILRLNPQLIVTTLAYHWSWKSLAFRVCTAKTLLVASDVFFHPEAVKPWYRQQTIDRKFRQIHFTTMTDELQLLKSYAKHHDEYFCMKYPQSPCHSRIPFYEGLILDDQISVIGAPIHPAFTSITDSEEIKRLRKKWSVPDNAVCVTISRGRLGYDTDLRPAIESYRTDQELQKPVILQVVCGENRPFYNKLMQGGYKNLGPNITLIPHPLLAPQDFAELRAISTFDDIKAGGGSTFEGWYLISQGTQSMLLLTPGPTLWWERSNCDAMQKWGIGKTIPEGSNKIAIIQEVMQKGLPQISHRFPDWKPLFDKTVTSLLPRRSKP